MTIFITRPQREDRAEMGKLFSSVIQDAFEQDGIGSLTQDIQEEVKKQMQFLDQDFVSGGKDFYFLIARAEDQIVGTIAYSKANDLIKKHIKENLDNVPEITTVYILPKFQGKGIGSLLFNAILLSLLHKNITEVCLDGGYKKSQSFWIKKLGEPNVLLRDYYGKGLDYMIWHRRLKDLPIEYKVK